jgi:hypothetical protein
MRFEGADHYLKVPGLEVAWDSVPSWMSTLHFAGDVPEPLATAGTDLETEFRAVLQSQN